MNPARRTTQAATTALVLATTGALLSTAAPAASAATTCTAPVYTRQFFANTTFSGTPKKTDCDASIAENWGANAPATGLPKDNFGVRWTLTRDFGSGGPFAVTAAAQDGIRVYVDGQRKVDLWKNVTTTVRKTVNLTIPSGRHTLRIDYANWTGNANVNFAYAPRTSATVDKVKPLAPTAPTVTYDKATGKAKLTWAKNKEMDLAGYRIYRRLNGTPFGSTPLATTTATATTYTDSTLPVTGEKFAYSIRAYDKAGNVSAGTADLAVTTVDRVAPGVPQDVALVGSTSSDGMRIGWSTVGGAVSYRVYRAPEVYDGVKYVPGAYAMIGSTSGLAYRDTSAAENKGYYYLLTAVDAAGNESARSKVVTGRLWDDVPPPAVTGLTVTPTEYGFELDWDANSAEDLAYYRLYRGTLGDYDEDGVEDCLLSVAREYLPADRTSFTYTAVSDSYKYTALLDGEQGCFLVDAVDDFGNSSFKWTGEGRTVMAGELDMRPSVATPEGSPLELTTTGSEGATEGNLLNWTWSSTAQETTGYRVHRWNPATKAYEKIADLGADANDYYDTDAPRDTTSFYWVTTLAADGTESVPAGAWAVNTPAT
ncbi:PA14 domain-containing protein [Streptomyces sp. ME02-8801-2C]|uniref:fibronectin type III domain-containing protein n=1 Tax=Streptomyces sp. ME02-8801-2C TaxID=3028680 RepID=UPI0029B50844|nr:PA14 domain-containing protein [Streptomyces sp. ME02-8801-2C]MDX3453771.1 PA14 domain-containing protein [Streptomyces sp. ME02-8801-2C]